MTAYLADPLSVDCPFWRCMNPAGMRCGTASGWTRPHKARIKHALVLAAHADPSLDEWFPDPGPCGICGVPGLSQRHRVIDAIAGALEAGDTPDELAADYNLSEEAVLCVQAWCERWQGAWT